MTEASEDVLLSLRQHKAPDPPARPVEELKQDHTVRGLRRKLSERQLPITGTKTDLALRVAKYESFVDLTDVFSQFSESELRKRIPDSAEKSKDELCKEYLRTL